MKPKLIIGNKNYSSWSLRPWLLLSAHNVPFEEIRVVLYTENTHSILSAYTDAGKVPVLHDGDLVIWDSLAICEYVSERYLAGGGWPGDMQARAEARSCSAEMHSGFFQLRDKLPMNCRATGRKAEMTPDLQLEINRVTGLWAKLRQRYGGAGPWLFGEFSIADCMFAPVVCRFRTYGIPVPDVCAAYMDQVLSHDSMKLWYQHAGAEIETIENAEVGL